MNRWLTLALVGVTLAIGALTLGTASQLPARVATHFDWSGHPNGWMDRETYVIVHARVQRRAAVARLRDDAVASGACVTRTTGSRRRAATQRCARWVHSLPRLALAIALFVASMHLAIVKAHATQPIRLDNGTLVTALVLFSAAMIGFAIAHRLRFRRPRGSSNAALKPAWPSASRSCFASIPGCGPRSSGSRRRSFAASTRRSSICCAMRSHVAAVRADAGRGGRRIVRRQT